MSRIAAARTPKPKTAMAATAGGSNPPSRVTIAGSASSSASSIRTSSVLRGIDSPAIRSPCPARPARCGRGGQPTGKAAASAAGLVQGAEGALAEAAGERAVDAVRPERAAVDHAGVALDEGGPGADALPHVVGGLDAADRDQREPPAGAGGQPPQDPQGPRR